MVLSARQVVVDVKVKNLKRALGFYSKQLGLKPLVVERDWASVGAKNIELHLNPFWGARDGVEFLVNDIKAAVRQLRARGVKTSIIETHDWGKISYFKDSEGNKLAVVEER